MMSGASPTPVGSERASASTATSSAPFRPRLRQTEAMFLLRHSEVLALRSTNVPPDAPRLKASRPYAPLPAKRSTNRAAATRSPRLENTACLIPSVAGRTASPLGTRSSMPRALPPLMRMAPPSNLGFASCASFSSLGPHAAGHAMTLPPSDHFNGKTFFNPGGESPRGMLDVLKWRLTSRATPWQGRVEVDRRPLPPAPAGEGIAATWVGQSTFLIRSASSTVITDPVFSDTAGPLPGLGP